MFSTFPRPFSLMLELTWSVKLEVMGKPLMLLEPFLSRTIRSSARHGIFLAVVVLRWQQNRETGQISTPAEMLVVKLTLSSKARDFPRAIVQHNTVLQGLKMPTWTILGRESLQWIKYYVSYMVDDWKARKQKVLFAPYCWESEGVAGNPPWGLQWWLCVVYNCLL